MLWQTERSAHLHPDSHHRGICPLVTKPHYLQGYTCRISCKSRPDYSHSNESCCSRRLNRVRCDPLVAVCKIISYTDDFLATVHAVSGQVSVIHLCSFGQSCQYWQVAVGYCLIPPCNRWAWVGHSDWLWSFLTDRLCHFSHHIGCTCTKMRQPEASPEMPFQICVPAARFIGSLFSFHHRQDLGSMCKKLNFLRVALSWLRWSLSSPIRPAISSNVASRCNTGWRYSGFFWQIFSLLVSHLCAWSLSDSIRFAS